MDKEILKPITTGHGELRIYRDWDCEGAIYMENAQTLDKYQTLKAEMTKVDTNEYGVFFAFTQQAFESHRNELIKRGKIKGNDEICAFGGGVYGTKKGYSDLCDYYRTINDRISNECEPQEIYLYEWNNQECMFGDDSNCYALVKHIFGNRAESVQRF